MLGILNRTFGGVEADAGCVQDTGDGVSIALKGLTVTVSAKP